MYGLKEITENEKHRLESIKQIVEKQLADVPDGKLRITSTGSYVQYMHCTADDKQGKYLKKENQDLAIALAQKAYDQKVKRLVDRRLRQINKLSAEYKDDEIEEIYEKLHPVRRTLIQPVIKPWEQVVIEWKSIPYVGKDFNPGTPEIYTKKTPTIRYVSNTIVDIHDD